MQLSVSPRLTQGRSKAWRPAAAAGNRCPGRYGTPPPGTTTRCEELAGTDPAQMPVRESAAPEPKTATVERREASVLRGTQGASLGAWPAALRAGPTGASQAPVRLSALRPPLQGVREATKQNPGAKTRRGNEIGCLKKTRGAETVRYDSYTVCRPHPEERRNRSTRCNARTRVSRDEDSTDIGALMLRDAAQRDAGVERSASASRCSSA